MEKSIFGYILRYSLRQQIILTILAAVSFPFLYLFYELPKQIVNNAIQADPAGFPVAYFGYEFDQMTYLFVLCGVLLALIVVNQGFKYVINVYRGLTGERMLRRLRYDLYARTLRFPLATFRKMGQGEIVSMITAEVEPLGGFISEAFSLPAFQGGTLLVILGFLLAQNPFMAAAAVALYPIQFYVIPKLQRRLNALAKERVRRVRRLSDRIGESVQGAQEVHVHDTSNLELANFSSHLAGIFHVRYRIYVLKFLVKFVNNFIQQLGPFFFFSIGGYLTIRGELEIGTLLAAIAAHKDLGSPWKELLGYYQKKEDSRVKYDQVTEQFQPVGLMPEEYQLEEPAKLEPLKGTVVGNNLVLTDEQEVNLIDGVNFSVPLDQRVAVVGTSGSGKNELTHVLGRLVEPSRGSLTVGGLDLARQPEAITGRRMSYVGPSTFIFNGTLEDNLFYGLKHRPLRPAENVDEETRRAFAVEAEAVGNTPHAIEDDWIDYEAAGVSDMAGLRRAGLEVLAQVGLSDDVYRLGLRGTIDPGQRPELAEAILQARAALSERLADPSIAALIERFDPEAYNMNATVAENMMFGTPIGDAFDMAHLAENAYVQQVLDKVGLTDPMLHAGYQVAATMVELFADLPPDHEFFQQFSFISAEDLPEFQAILNRVSREQLDELRPDDRVRLLSLPFMLIPARHRLGAIDTEMQSRILEARTVFAADLPAELANKIAFFEPESYSAAANLQDNILFGKVAYGQAQAQERVADLIGEVVADQDLKAAVSEVGLGFGVGIAGSRLGAAQRQKLAIARAVIKHPDLLILAEATAPLDTMSQALIMENLLQEFAGRGLFWALHRTKDAGRFDHILVMKGGKIVEQGSFAELDRDGSVLRDLIASESG